MSQHLKAANGLWISRSTPCSRAAKENQFGIFGRLLHGKYFLYHKDALFNYLLILLIVSMYCRPSDFGFIGATAKVLQLI